MNTYKPNVNNLLTHLSPLAVEELRKAFLTEVEERLLGLHIIVQTLLVARIDDVLFILRLLEDRSNGLIDPLESFGVLR